LLIALDHWRLGFVLFTLGEYEVARDHLEEIIAFYEPRHHDSFVSICGADGGLSALAYQACCLWALGYPEQGFERSQEALVRARELEHPFTSADVLTYGGCLFAGMRRDARAVKVHAEELLRLASEARFPDWHGMALVFQGEALAMLGQPQEGVALIRAGNADRDTFSVRLHFTHSLCVLAEAEAKAGNPCQALATLDDASALLDSTDERCWEAELNRIRAEILLSQDREAKAEESYLKAMEVARRQKARSWELRAATGLARLWQEQGKAEEAHDLLSEIYNWFTEGFDTPDLQEARQLLDQLAREPDAEERP
jgi:predicted ATPase